MTWGYRLCSRGEGEKKYFVVHEVYYNKDGDIEGWTQDEILGPYDTPGELAVELGMIANDSKRWPVIDLDKLEAEHDKRRVD